MLDFVFFLVGSMYLLKISLEAYNIIRGNIGKTDIAKYGKSWALITACTDGIGLGFSEELAKKGFNIIQVGRNPQKLKSVGQDLITKYGIEVKSIVKDFSECHKNPIVFFNDIYSQCQHLDISILVNNIGYGSPKEFLHSSTSILNQNALNLFPLVFLTRLFLKKLTGRPQGAGIINLSSIAANCPTPEAGTIYSAGKSFDLVFSNVLSEEVDIDVLALQPGFVDTPLTESIKVKVLRISRQECAVEALKRLGKVKYTNGHWKHALSMVALEITPSVIISKIIQ